MQYTEKLTIKYWAEEDRPREKSLLQGIHTLSNAELLTILLATGTKDMSALDISKHILSENQNSLQSLGKKSLHDLKKYKGIGLAKAVIIAAAFELGKRRFAEDPLQSNTIKSIQDAHMLFFAELSDLSHEEFWVAYLNVNGKVLALERISKGGLASTIVDIRLILHKALIEKASSIILAHNHPSGNLSPSYHDKNITEQLKKAASLMDISIQDHIIIANQNYFSFAENGLI
jgi:DNA repair protein RadC